MGKEVKRAIYPAQRVDFETSIRTFYFAPVASELVLVRLLSYGGNTQS
jgi:hypothetical protein